MPNQQNVDAVLEWYDNRVIKPHAVSVLAAAVRELRDQVAALTTKHGHLIEAYRAQGHVFGEENTRLREQVAALTQEREVCRRGTGKDREMIACQVTEIDRRDLLLDKLREQVAALTRRRVAEELATDVFRASLADMTAKRDALFEEATAIKRDHAVVIEGLRGVIEKLREKVVKYWAGLRENCDLRARLADLERTHAAAVESAFIEAVWSTYGSQCDTEIAEDAWESSRAKAALEGR